MNVIFPDGTTQEEPNEGFILFQGTEKWRYSASIQGWRRLTGFSDDDVDAIDPYIFGEIEIQAYVPKCECGSTAVGGDRHSTWCQLFSSPL